MGGVPARTGRSGGRTRARAPSGRSGRGGVSQHDQFFDKLERRVSKKRCRRCRRKFTPPAGYTSRTCPPCRRIEKGARGSPLSDRLRSRRRGTRSRSVARHGRSCPRCAAPAHGGPAIRMPLGGTAPGESPTVVECTAVSTRRGESSDGRYRRGASGDAAVTASASHVAWSSVSNSRRKAASAWRRPVSVSLTDRALLAGSAISLLPCSRSIASPVEGLPRPKKVLPQQNVAGTVGHRHDPSVPVQLDDAVGGVVEQRREGGVQTVNIAQHLAHAHVLAQMRQQTLDHVDLVERPAVPFHGVGKGPHDARSVRTVQAHGQAAPAGEGGARWRATHRDLRAARAQTRVTFHSTLPPMWMSLARPL